MNMTSFGDYPDSKPEVEEVVSDDTLFAEECIREIDYGRTNYGWVLGPPIITKSRKWGNICRFDVVMPGGENKESAVCKAVCWRFSGEQLKMVIYDASSGDTVPNCAGQ